MIVIGLGPPRSGTTSLARLLDGCDRVTVTHERGPRPNWNTPDDSFTEYIEWVAQRNAKTWGDVACWHLPAAEMLLRWIAPNIRMPVMLRPSSETVESLLRKNRRYCTTDPRTDFPSWPEITDREAFARYWTIYVDRCLHLAGQFPRQIRIFPIGALNMRDGQSEIFDFCGVSASDRRFQIPCHYNANR